MNKLFIIIFSFIGITAYSQEFEFLNYSESNEQNINQDRKAFKHSLLNEIDSPILDTVVESSEQKQVAPKSKLVKDTDVSLSLGSMVGVGSNDSYFINNYITPSVSFKLSEKFHVNAGVGYSFSRLDGYIIGPDSQAANGNVVNVHSIFAYVSGVYKLNPKTSVFTSILFEHEEYSGQGLDISNNNFSELAVGVNYKVTPFLHFNAQVSLGNKPYSNSYFSPNGINMNPSIGF